MGRTKNLLGVLLALLLVVAGAGIAGAATAVIDRSHGQPDLTGFKKALTDMEWQVVDQTASLATGVASGCNLLVVPQPVSSDFTEAEVAQVRAYVEAGGGLFVLGEADGPECTAFQKDFGVTLNRDRVLNCLGNPTDNFEVLVPGDLSTHPILKGVASFEYAGGCSLTVDPAVSLVVTGSDMDLSYSQAEDYYYYWSYPPVLAATALEGEGAGKAVFLGDTDSIAANQQLLTNIVNWLKKPEAAPPEEPETTAVTVNLLSLWHPHNKINLNAKGFIRVAIMSEPKSDLKPGFDAAAVDAKTVTFAGAHPVCSKLQKVNRDQLKDLVLVFWIPDLRKDSGNPNGLTCDSTTAELSGNLKESGPSISGESSVEIVKNSYCWKPPANGKCGGKKGK